MHYDTLSCYPNYWAAPRRLSLLVNFSAWWLQLVANLSKYHLPIHVLLLQLLHLQLLSFIFMHVTVVLRVPWRGNLYDFIWNQGNILEDIKGQDQSKVVETWVGVPKAMKMWLPNWHSMYKAQIHTHNAYMASFYTLISNLSLSITIYGHPWTVIRPLQIGS